MLPGYDEGPDTLAAISGSMRGTGQPEFSPRCAPNKLAKATQAGVLLALPGNTGARRVRITRVRIAIVYWKAHATPILAIICGPFFGVRYHQFAGFWIPIATTVKGLNDIVSCLRWRALISVGYRNYVVAILYAVEFGDI